jgi:hypothetical protein
MRDGKKQGGRGHWIRLSSQDLPDIDNVTAADIERILGDAS